jgi:mannosyl-3-phosphoglycerate phosphatase family protein
MRVILTSLEGNLLDPETSSCGAARQALAALERRAIPLILVSSKTRAQLENIRTQLELEHPFIAEEGSIICVPKHYFPESILDQGWVYLPPYYVCVLGLPYDQIQNGLQQIRQKLGLGLIGYGDWTATELAMALGIAEEEAERAQQREFSEIFSYAGDPSLLQAAFAELAQQFPHYWIHLHPLKKRALLNHWYFSAHQRHRPPAAQILLECYQKHLGSISSLGLGNALTDASFLRYCSQSLVLPSPEAEDLWAMAEKTWKRAELGGPEGWNEAVLRWLEEPEDEDVRQDE